MVTKIYTTHKMKKIIYFFILLLFEGTMSGQVTEMGNLGNNESYILTPEPSPKPKITGAKVLGVHPGNPVIFTIPATGNRPMTFTAKNLPEGLSLDSSSGRFSGSIVRPGTYSITIYAKNELGTYKSEFRIIAGDKLALTPPMGWNSWNGWGIL